MSKPSIAVAVPAYNESESIAEFICEIDEALRNSTDDLTFVIVDDRSTDDTSDVVKKVETDIRGRVEVITNARNMGHGPTVLAAYRGALESGADLVLQVDGDGQFLGSDLRRVMLLLHDGAEVVNGVRRFRYDPWFRMVMTRVLRLYVSSAFGVVSRDTNCPLRGYRSGTLRELLEWVPQGALVPNLYLTILAARRGVSTVEVDVNHRVRRGASSTGTMWSSGGLSAIVPTRLLRFSAAALIESRSFHRHINSGRRPEVSALDG